MVAFLGEMEPNQFIVFRFLIWCCTSDALPVPGRAEYDRADEFKSNSRVRVVAKPHIWRETVGRKSYFGMPKDPYLY
jgi:uncharacterized membrane protein YcgQ (UPF0703/DUF1980 family)